MKQLCFLLLAFSPIVGYAQNGYSAGFSLITEYSYSSFDTKGMNGFVNTFNEFWGQKLSKPYSEFSGHEFSHPKFGIGFRFLTQGNAGFTASTAFLYGRKKYQHSATWANDVQNELDFKVRDLSWTVTTGMHIRNAIFLEVFFDANGRKLEMAHATIYQDGSKSLSSEYKLNGLYTGKIASSDIGLQLGFRLGPILLYCKPTWALKNFPPGKDLVTLDDYTNVNYPPTDFPSDYRKYTTDPLGYVEQNLGVKTDDFEGFRLAFGAELIFGGKNKKKD
ncbi:MAG: hypothetical protein GC192_14980 [Bacteroidetes bacterium]|nr:hypothetical protein [Bacteroidota bacterium]